MKVESLLNQEPSRAPLRASRPVADSPVFLPARTEDEPTRNTRSVETNMTRDSKGARKSQLKGFVNFAPFEDLDEAALAAVRQFEVSSFGAIQQSSRRIPYNSGKKQFSQKTGRECFEVFQYDFRPEGEGGQRYTIMWDYQIGLVRMTPFFKCCKYPKTMPAKMLSQNSGLKDITHSITGGSITAQGYWMPYLCAKEACATFCCDIAGALIPIFGPDFPSICIPRDMPGFAKFVISQDTIERSRQEAERFRMLNLENGPRLTPRLSGSISPRRTQYDTGYLGYNTDNRESLYMRRKRASVNSSQGIVGDAEAMVSPGDGSRGWYAGQYTGMESATTTPRSAVMHSPNWPVISKQPTLYHRQHHSCFPNDGLYDGPGTLYRDVKQILNAEHGGGQHSYSHHHSAPSHSQPSLAAGNLNQRGKGAHRYPDGAFECAVVEDHGGRGSTTMWPREAGESFGSASQDAVARGDARGSHHAAEKDAAMVLVHLREQETLRHKELDVDRNHDGAEETTSTARKPNGDVNMFGSSGLHQPVMSTVTTTQPGGPIVKKRRATLM